MNRRPRTKITKKQTIPVLSELITRYYNTKSIIQAHESVLKDLYAKNNRIGDELEKIQSKPNAEKAKVEKLQHNMNVVLMALKTQVATFNKQLSIYQKETRDWFFASNTQPLKKIRKTLLTIGVQPSNFEQFGIVFPEVSRCKGV